MKKKKVLLVSFIIMIITIVCMIINWTILPLPDSVVRAAGVIMLIDLFVLGFSTMGLRTIKK